MSFFASLRNVAVKDSDRAGMQSQSPIVCISINGVDTRVINTRQDRSIRIWKSQISGLVDPVIIDNAHAGPVSSISWLPTAETTFASAGGDSSVKLWRGNGSLEREISVGDGLVCHITAFSPDGTLLLAATTSGEIFVFDVLDNYSQITHLQATEGDAQITDVKWTHKGLQCFLVGLSSGPILIFNYENQSLAVIHSLLGCRSVTCLLVDPRGKYIAAGSKDGVVSFWQTSDMVNCRALTSIDQEISSLTAGRDGNWICVGYGAGSNSRVFESESLKEIHEIPGSISGKDNRSIVAWYATKNKFVYSSEQGCALAYVKKDERNSGDVKYGLGDGRHKVGDGRLNQGDGRQNYGNGRQNHGDGRQNHGDGRQNHGDGRHNHGDGRHNHGDGRHNQGDGRYRSGDGRYNHGDNRRRR